MAEKIKFNVEYEVKSSPKILFGFLNEPNGLALWFADDVTYRDQVIHLPGMVISKKQN